MDIVLSTCKEAAGLTTPTTNAVATTAAGQASAGTGAKAGAAHLALPTGLTERLAVAAAAGIIGAIL
jgi:hypothetical protein